MFMILNADEKVVGLVEDKVAEGLSVPLTSALAEGLRMCPVENSDLDCVLAEFLRPEEV